MLIFCAIVRWEASFEVCNVRLLPFTWVFNIEIS